MFHHEYTDRLEDVHCSIVYNKQRLDTTYASIRAGFTKLTVCHMVDHRAAGEKIDVALHVLRYVLCVGSKVQTMCSVFSLAFVCFFDGDAGD